ncbi:polysaccharide deacetylase family protein [Glutamicibacter uratoxydans]|nr:polysaccharide deacetylase family protein [Glutamicibacter uratoxydans]
MPASPDGHLVPLSSRRSLLAFGAAALGSFVLSGCAADGSSESSLAPANSAPSVHPAPAPASPAASSTGAVAPGDGAPEFLDRDKAIDMFKGRAAGSFGLEVPGIQLGLPEGAKFAALTFDACGGPRGSAVDTALLSTLRAHRAPATLFINQRWARANPGLMKELVADPLFEIANHGTLHAPLCIAGQKAYGIPGTASVGSAYDEVMENQRYMAGEFGVDARFFRSGTAHMDEAGAALCRALGIVPMNFTRNLDAGATFAASAVASQVKLLKSGDVGIGHFNQPGSGTAAGVRAGLGPLLDSGIKLATLSQGF